MFTFLFITLMLGALVAAVSWRPQAINAVMKSAESSQWLRINEGGGYQDD